MHARSGSRVLLVLCSLQCVLSSSLKSTSTRLQTHVNTLRSMRQDSIDSLDSNEGFTIQNSTPFYTSLLEVSQSVPHRFFFPGHNGGRFLPTNSFLDPKLDLPELELIDSLHSPNGTLQQSLQLAAHLFGALRTWFLVNGSTSGLLSAILAAVKIHRASISKRATDRSTPSLSSQMMQRPILVIGRDSHKSVYDAISLSGCEALLLPCSVDAAFGVALGVTYKSIQTALESYPGQVCGVVITRPTYQGVCCTSSELRRIADLCHEHCVPLIVDEAHGSHLRFLGLSDLQDGMSCGADITIQSSHKTLTSLSQTGMMHLGPEAFKFSPLESFLSVTAATSCHNSAYPNIEVEDNEQNLQCIAITTLQQCYSMLTTTSANSLLIASLDLTRKQMATCGRKMVDTSATAANSIRQKIRLNSNTCSVRLLDDSAAIKELHLCVDPLRLSVRFERENSVDVDDAMCQNDGIYCELNLSDCVTYGISPGHDSSSLSELETSLLSQTLSELQLEVPQIYNKIGASPDESGSWYASHNELGHLQSTAGLDLLSTSTIPIELSDGHISADTVCVYPPGIPIVAKGEKITSYHLEYFKTLSLGRGQSITGTPDESFKTIRVLLP